MRTLCLVLLTVAVVMLLLWVVPAEPAGSLHPYGYRFEARTCLWCGRGLGKGQVYFDLDNCGRQWADQIAVRGYLVYPEEIVDVNGDVRPHPP